MRAMTVMIVVGMSGFVLGPLLGGHRPGPRRLAVAAPRQRPDRPRGVIGVRFGVPADRREDLTRRRPGPPGARCPSPHRLRLLRPHQRHRTRLDVPGHDRFGAGRGRRAPRVRPARADRRPADAGPRPCSATGPSAARLSPRSAPRSPWPRDVQPDPALPVRLRLEPGARRTVANLPLILTMIVATPVSEKLAHRFGHRNACLIGAGLLAAALAGLAVGGNHGYPVIAACMVVLTVGLRTVMTICAVALVSAAPENRTSLAASLNDTAQEVGTQRGHRGRRNPHRGPRPRPPFRRETWSAELVQSFFHGEPHRLHRPGRGRRGRRRPGTPRP